MPHALPAPWAPIRPPQQQTASAPPRAPLSTSLGLRHRPPGERAAAQQRGGAVTSAGGILCMPFSVCQALTVLHPLPSLQPQGDVQQRGGGIRVRALRSRPVQQLRGGPDLQGEPASQPFFGLQLWAPGLLYLNQLPCCPHRSSACTLLPPGCPCLQTCPAGTYSGGGAPSCKQCGPGFYSTAGSGVCSPW